MKYISILGSTGSIGTQTLDVIEANVDKFSVVALVANSNIKLLEEQIDKFKPDIAVIVDEEIGAFFKAGYKGKTKILLGENGLMEAAVYHKSDIVVTSLVGFAGLKPTIAAINAGKNIALANKETLVAAGEIVMSLAGEKNVSILPVDSEHSAIFQCLQGEEKAKIEKIILTASGGPFRGKSTAELKSVSLEQCLKHPNWSMGQKITVDSASLANKGLEVIEAKWLYDVEYNQIEVVVHPQSIIHSMVEFVDGAIMAQMGLPDMKLPIQYALTYPKREKANFPKFSFQSCNNLTFENPDTDTFKALALAYEAGIIGGTMPCVFNAANEMAVNAFLKRELPFLDIPTVIKECMDKHKTILNYKLEDLYFVDSQVREMSVDIIKEVNK